MAQVYLDYTKDGKVSLTKAFLKVLAGEKSGFDLYYEYFKKYTLIDSDYNLSALSRFSEPEQRRVVGELYHLSDQTKEPDWMSFWSAHDVNRVANLSDVEVVVYITASKDVLLPGFATGQWIKRRMSDIEIYHDYRSTGFGRGFTNEGGSSNSSGSRSKCIYLMLAVCGATRKLYCLDCDIAMWIDKQFSVVGMPFERARTSVSVTPDDGGCEDFLDCLSLMLSSESVDVPEPRLRINCPNDFLCVSEDSVYEHLNSRIAGGLVRPCIVVAYTRNSGRVPYKVQLSRTGSKPKGHFSTLAVVSSVPSSRPFSERVPKPELCEVICLFGQYHVALLAEYWRRLIVSNHFQTSGLKEKLHNRHLTRLEGLSKKVSPGELQEVLEAAEALRRGPKRKKHHRKKCKCQICHIKKDYNLNMSCAGPERLCSTQYTISDLLKIVNIELSDDLLERIVELSVAAMDIESKTDTVSLVTPRPGPSVEYAEIDQAVLEGHIKRVQTPIMIAHTDALTLDSTWSLTAEGDEISYTFKLMADYWTLLLERRNDCVRQKKELSQPIFDILTEYRNAFTKYYFEHVQTSRTKAAEAYQESLVELESSHEGTDEELELLKAGLSQKSSDLLAKLPEAKGCIKAWKSTLPGMLESRLSDLVCSYTVFSFCG